MTETDHKSGNTAVLLLNLGGPDSLEAVRPFLYNLFSDREIIRLGPPFLQKPLAWLISALRSGKTRKMYRLIGGKSPILDITNSQAKSLEKELNVPGASSSGPRYRVYIGMRYWHPFMADTLNKIREDGAESIVVISLYPHYSKATTGSSLSDFKSALEKLRSSDPDFHPHIVYIEHWYDFPPYIDALASSVARGITESGSSDYDLLYSAHSLPESFILEGDPYLDHIKKTILLTNDRLSSPPYNIRGIRWHLSFQSKTGPVKWLGPSTEEMIRTLSAEGCRNLIAVPISFVSDHIETLYEIDILYKKIAKNYRINLIRCDSLNTAHQFIYAIKELVISEMCRE